MTDDGKGILGGLPRERPGRRSARRAPATGGAPARVAAEPVEPESPSPADRPGAGLPDPARVVTAVARGGARLAARAGAELLRRLPRP